ncbi:MAG: hypothetical protein K2X29_06785 [Candidatus Obscuribacterales bacterium]|nr:hypothetical protein [Candidatus Obscuribacterales bacterium]
MTICLKVLLAAISFLFCFSQNIDAAEQKSLIVVLNFSGPGLIKSDDTLGFRLRTGEERPRHRELKELGADISKQLTDKFKAEFGNQAMSVGETGCQLPQGQLMRLVDKKRFSELGEALNCRYAISGKVNFAEFDGHLLTGDKYKVHVSCRLIDCQNNVVLWHLMDHDFDKLMWTQSGKDPLDVFYERQVPAIVDYLYQHVTQIIGSPKAS